jgi:DNA mismatch endonuclease (patch repair protein)
MKPRQDLNSRPRIPAPSFKGFTSASEASSRAKRRNTSTNTRAEIMLCRALSEHRLRYRRNVGTMPGKPDVVFTAPRVAVFCDGDFWHGRAWPQLKRQLERRANAAYWIPKIAANRLRDARTRLVLTRAGWLVIRVWETDVARDPRAVAETIKKAVTQRRLAPRAPASGTAALTRAPSPRRSTGSTGSAVVRSALNRTSVTSLGTGSATAGTASAL